MSPGKKSLRDIFLNKEHHYFLPFVIIVTLLLAIWMFFFAHNSILSWIKAGVEVKRQEKTIKEYREDIDRMNTEIKALTSDRDSLEKFAREQYKFAAPDEDVYLEK